MAGNDAVLKEHPKRVAVIGAGSWGTALAQTLALAGSEVIMWARKEEVARGIRDNHVNPRYLSDNQLQPSITATTDLLACVSDVDAVVLVTPSQLIRKFASDLKPILGQDTSRTQTPLIVCSKGVEANTGLLPLEICAEELGGIERMAALSGPNHAEEVIIGKPSGTVIASVNEDVALLFRDLFTTDTFRCYLSSDYIGVELCAAFKNIIAIAVGLAYGVDFGDNTSAMIITRGMAEMGRLVKACGGQTMTVMGLAGAGDLIATCTSEHSRNRRFGELVARGGTLEQFQNETHMVVEGAIACQTILPLAERYQVELPLAQAVCDVIWNGAPIVQVTQRLFDRPARNEFWGF